MGNHEKCDGCSEVLLKETWRSLEVLSDMQRSEEKTTPNSLGSPNTAEAKALWRQRQEKQNILAHQATEFLKARGMTWNGYKKK